MGRPVRCRIGKRKSAPNLEKVLPAQAAEFQPTFFLRRSAANFRFVFAIAGEFMH